MQTDAGLTGDAATLARDHEELLGRLPATVHAFILVELQKWPTLFDAERRYHRALLDHLSGLPAPRLRQAAAGIARVEAEAALPRDLGGNPARFQEEAQALLRRRRLAAAWRQEVDALFQQLDPAIEATLFPANAPRRLIVQLYGSGIAIQPGSLWRHFTGTGARVPLKVEGTQGTEAFLQGVFTGGNGSERGRSLFATARESARLAPLDSWIIEAHEELHELCEGEAAGESITGLSYDRLSDYRAELTRALYDKIQTGVESPQAFAAHARSLRITPRPGALLHSADIVQAFIRDVFLTGNGTLFVNNTFVEWAAVQALRRAQPRILVARYGVRDRLKPFSSMLLFSQPRVSDRIPDIEDPVGSFVDVEKLSYYVWLNAEKGAGYRGRTLYLFLAEGFDEMLAIRSDAPLPTAGLPRASLTDVCATMAAWLGVPAPEPSGHVIAPLVS